MHLIVLCLSAKNPFPWCFCLGSACVYRWRGRGAPQRLVPLSSARAWCQQRGQSDLPAWGTPQDVFAVFLWQGKSSAPGLVGFNQAFPFPVCTLLHFPIKW